MCYTSGSVFATSQDLVSFWLVQRAMRCTTRFADDKECTQQEEAQQASERQNAQLEQRLKLTQVELFFAQKNFWTCAGLFTVRPRASENNVCFGLRKFQTQKSRDLRAAESRKEARRSAWVKHFTIRPKFQTKLLTVEKCFEYFHRCSPLEIAFCFKHQRTFLVSWQTFQWKVSESEQQKNRQ